MRKWLLKKLLDSYTKWSLSFHKTSTGDFRVSIHLGEKEETISVLASRQKAPEFTEWMLREFPPQKGSTNVIQFPRRIPVRQSPTDPGKGPKGAG